MVERKAKQIADPSENPEFPPSDASLRAAVIAKIRFLYENLDESEAAAVSGSEKEIFTTEDTEEHGGRHINHFHFLRVLCVLCGESFKDRFGNNACCNTISGEVALLIIAFAERVLSPSVWETTLEGFIKFF